MGIISKPNTFTGQAAPQLNWLDADYDTLFAEFNGNIDDTNIKAAAAIAQSKILNLVADMAARLTKAGDTMTGALLLKLSTPYIRLIGTEASAKDWRLLESAGTLFLQRNDGTEAVPVWATVFQLKSTGIATEATDLLRKDAFDTAIALISSGLGFSKIVKTDANFNTSSATFVDVTGLTTTVTTRERRARISGIFVVKNNVGTPRQFSVNVQIDGASYGGTNGIWTHKIRDNDETTCSFSIVTNPLTAAAHTFKVQLLSQSGTSVDIVASAANNAVFTVEELVL